MKNVLAAALCLVLPFLVCTQVAAQTQMTSKGTNYGSSTTTLSPIDQERWVATSDQMGVRIDDTGAGPFNQMATDIKMILYADKAGVHYRGYETHMDKDGDKVIWEIWDFPSGSNKGKGTIIGATGKFAGMEGTMDFVLEHPKGFPAGTGRTVCREVMNLTLKRPL